jgi:hypothetical protein
MDIAALSMTLAQSNIMDSVSLAMLDKSLENSSEFGQDLTSMLDHSMELSVTPHIGSNIDISV